MKFLLPLGFMGVLALGGVSCSNSAPFPSKVVFLSKGSDVEVLGLTGVSTKDGEFNFSPYLSKGYRAEYFLKSQIVWTEPIFVEYEENNRSKRRRVLVEIDDQADIFNFTYEGGKWKLH